MGMLKMAFVVIALTLFGLQSCKRYFDPPFVDEVQQLNNKKQRKVLLIVVDGATGIDVKAIAPPKITAMLSNSKYTWDSWSDAPVSDAGTWKNIMTGVGGGKHGVRDSTFEIAEDPSKPHGSTVVQPSFIERLQATTKMRYSAAISPWKNLNDKLLVYVDQPITVANDAVVKDSTIAKIKEFKNDLVIANFNSVNLAGLKYGFSADIPEYKNAVLQVDTYIGELLEAVKGRKTYASEDWLVIVSSNHGGLGKGYTSGDKREKNVFNIYYNANFSGAEILVPKVTEALTFDTKNTFAGLPVADGAAYNLGTTGDFTIQFKVLLKNVSTGTNHAVLLSKINAAYGTVNGWEFMWEASTRKFRVLVGGGTAPIFIVGNLNPGLDTWTTLAFKVFTKDGKRYGQIYNNGKPGSDPVLLGAINIGNNTTSLNIGTITKDITPGVTTTSLGTCSQMVNQLAIYNVALPDDVLQNAVCQTEIKSTDPYYNNLIGYWPCSEGEGDRYINRSPLAVGKDLIVKGTTGWNMVANWDCQPVKNSKLMRNTDIAAQVFYWFGVPISDKWGLDGKIFLSAYESEFIK